MSKVIYSIQDKRNALLIKHIVVFCHNSRGRMIYVRNMDSVFEEIHFADSVHNAGRFDFEDAVHVLERLKELGYKWPNGRLMFNDYANGIRPVIYGDKML